MEEIKLVNIRLAEDLSQQIFQLKNKIEERINLKHYSTEIKPLQVSNNLMQRISLMAGLSLHSRRNLKLINEIKLTSNQHFHDTVFTRNDYTHLWTALLKIRYNDIVIDWDNLPLKSKVINNEMIEGAKYLLNTEKLDEWLLNKSLWTQSKSKSSIPVLNLHLGKYEDDIDAFLNVNGKEIPNTQIIISGSTGSGKTNLLAVLLNEIRNSSVETSYPVNFLLFDYKGEFSDPSNSDWLNLLEVDSECIIDPIKTPLPFSPFKNFEGKTQNEINLYATELSNALCSIDIAKISANMSNRLSLAVINSYKKTKNRPVSFDIIFNEYTALQTPKDAEKTDSVKSLLQQLMRSNLFIADDDINLINNSFIIKMDGFPKDGPIAKAIVYFTIAKLNIMYENLQKQEVNDECVEIRHFTVIDEAHYMLDFDNRPLRNLIAVGRNKGLSIILSTQNMESYKSEHFDFYANAQYPLIMKQQTINDKVIKDLFGVSGSEFQEIKEAIAGLQKGELIIKDYTAITLSMGKKYKKIKVNHLI
ncbi:MAG: ATP-binding protein [Bacteroidales bacterium]|nr:ATP-binding protein [Bacteroidales bacterium]